MHSRHTERNCPVCDNESIRIITIVDFALFDGHPMNGGYDLVQCNTCGFMYANTPVTQTELDKYYTELSKYEDKAISTGGGYTQNDKQRLIDTAIFLNNNITDKHARIVDLGCANGGLLKELKNLGFSNLIGIDPSSACVNITTNEVGCECYQYSIFDIPASIGKFDVILSTHVLEHLLNVRDAISIMDALLAPSGKIFLECPNANYYHEVIHAPLQEFNTEHINHFTEVAFQNLMGSFGYHPIAISDKVFQITSNQDYHAVYGLFERRLISVNNWKFDDVIRDNIQKYIDKSTYIFDGIQTKISSLPSSAPIALWGIGQFAFKLLKTEAFKNRTNLRLFDNGSATIGKSIDGMKIISGEEIVGEYKKAPFTIIVSSLIHEVSIRNAILNKFSLEQPLVPEIIGFSDLL